MNLELEAARAACIAKLVSIRIPNLSPRADEDQLLALSDAMFEAGQAMDLFFEACGVEFVGCAPGGNGFGKSLGYFRGRVVDAVNDARVEIQEAATIAASEFEEA